MKKFVLALLTSLMLTSCVVYADPPSPPPHPMYGCAMIEDDYGEREVCNTYYYESEEGIIYWDAYFDVWVGAGGYWHNGVWVRGFWPGYWNRYRGFYHGHGFYHGYSHHWGGGYHGSGGYHGGHSGGHGSHR